MGGETSRSQPSVEAVGLSVRYAPDRPVLENVTCGLEGAGIVRLDAPNGFGKTTFVEAASGYLRPTSGRLFVNGLDAHDPRSRADRRVCRSTPALHPHLSIVDHLAVAADLASVPRSAAVERAARFGLEEWFDTRTSALSTGTTRKLWYLLCTMGRFTVALLDEPFNGVDEACTAEMIDEWESWRRTALIVLVSHTIPPDLRIDSRVQLTNGPKEPPRTRTPR